MPYIAVRDPFADAKDTLSSWDKCMAKTYCKWPVIVAIVVGSLIILSIVLCIARCVCCGAEVACCCFKCCSCCGGSSKGSGHKRMKSDAQAGYPPPGEYQPPIPPPSIDSRPLNQQYRSHAAPTFNPAPSINAAPEQPQFARFDQPAKPVNEDALPSMPTWGEASSVHVEETVMPEKRGDMEMDRLNHNGSVANSSVSGATGAGAIGAAGAVGAMGAARRSPGRSPVQRSPTADSYGFPAGYQNDSFASAGSQQPPRNSPGPYGGQYEQTEQGYRGISPVQPQGRPQGRSPVYGGAAGYAQNLQQGRRTPGQGYQQQYDQPPRHSPAPQNDGYGYGAPPRAHDYDDAPYQNNGYAPAPARSPSPGYPTSASTRFEPSPVAYPGQQTYESNETSYPGQQTYQAFSPGTQGAQQTGVDRRPVNGSWREI